MVNLFAPFETEFLQNQLEHGEMVILLVSNHIYQFFGIEILLAELCRAEVLRHINGSAVLAEKQFLVEAVAGEVGPNGAVVLAEKNAVLKTFHNRFFAKKICVRFVINLVEIDAQTFVSLVESFVHPAVHRLPKAVHFGVLGLPFAEHLLRFEHQRCVFGGIVLAHALFNKFLNLFFVVFVEKHVVFSDKVVAFLARRFGSFAVAVFQPRQHRFADVDSAVVHKVHLLYVVAVGFEQFRHRPAEQVVAYVAEVQRFVGVRRRIFHHYRGFAAFRGLKAILLCIGIIHHKINPIVFVYLKIQKTFYHVERSH